MKQTAVIVIFPPGIAPAIAESYLRGVISELPPPMVGSGPLQVGSAGTFNPDLGTPVVYQP